jgi:hypothetical protein
MISQPLNKLKQLISREASDDIPCENVTLMMRTGNF